MPLSQPIRSAITVAGIVGVSRSSSRICTSTASTAESLADCRYYGGRSFAKARLTVFFEMPRCRAIARIGICSARCSRRISAQSSTRITFPPHLDHQGQSQTKITKWVTFDPPSEGQRSAVIERAARTGRIPELGLVLSARAEVSRIVLARDLSSGKLHEDRVVARAFIRMFGKVAAGPGDGDALLRVVCSEHIDIDTRIQGCWALANAGPRLPRAVTDSALETCRRQSFGVQSVTALRAAVATCGRASDTQALQSLLDDPTTALSVRNKCNWWRSLPRHVLPIPSDTKEAVILQVPRAPGRLAGAR